MGFIPQIDILDANGNSLIQANPDGSLPIVQIQVATGLVATFSKEGDIATIEIAPDPSAPITGGNSLALGSQSPPQFQIQTGTTKTISSGSNLEATIAVPVGKRVDFELRLVGHVDCTGPGIMVPFSACFFYAYANYGTSGPILANGPVIDTTRSTTNSPLLVGGAIFSVAVVGNTVQFSVVAYSVPAWSAQTYAGALKGGTTPPNAVASTVCAFVTNAGNIYVCTAGGVPSTVAPTGTGTSPITGVDGVTWYYVGPAASGLPVTYTVNADQILTG